MNHLIGYYLRPTYKLCKPYILQGAFELSFKSSCYGRPSVCHISTYKIKEKPKIELLQHALLGKNF